MIEREFVEETVKIIMAIVALMKFTLSTSHILLNICRFASRCSSLGTLWFTHCS